VVPADDRVSSVANFEILPLAVALDYLRIVLATALTAVAERVVKLLETPWSGLPTGLVSGVDETDIEPGGMVPDVEPLLELIGSGAVRL
jgi:histidine ammonia-lyase